MATAKLSAGAEKNGWRIENAQEPQTIAHGGVGKLSTGTIVVQAGAYTAYKRRDQTLDFAQGATMEELEANIEAYEKQHAPNEGNEPMSQEEKLASAKGTLSQQLSSGARQAAEVVLDDGESKGKAKAVRVEAHPRVSESPVDDDQAEGLAAAQKAARK